MHPTVEGLDGVDAGGVGDADDDLGEPLLGGAGGGLVLRHVGNGGPLGVDVRKNHLSQLAGATWEGIVSEHDAGVCSDHSLGS